MSEKLQERSQPYLKLGVLLFAAEIHPCLCMLRCSGLYCESQSETIAKRRSCTAKNKQFKRFHSRLMCQDIKCHFLYFKEGSGHSEGKIKCSTTTCLAGRSVLPSALNLKATQCFSTSLLSSRGRTSDLLVWSWIHQLLTPRGSKKLGARVQITSNNKQASNNQAQKLGRHFFLKSTTWEAGKAWVEQAKLMPSGS